MADPTTYGITGSGSVTLPPPGTSTTTTATPSQISSSFTGTLAQSALDQLNLALQQAGGSSTPVTVDNTGGPETIGGSGSSPSVFFAGSSTGTDVHATGSSPQIFLGGSGPFDVTGSNAPQTMVGGSGPTVFFAGTQGGNHLLVGGSGGSTLTGGTGSDTLTGGVAPTSHDTLQAGAGLHQLLQVSQGNNLLTGNADTAKLGVSDTLTSGTSGNDTLVSGATFHGDHTTFEVGFGTANTTVQSGLGQNSVFVYQGSGTTFIDGTTGHTQVVFGQETSNQAHISHSHGITTITFNGSSQVIELKGVHKVEFGDGHTIKI